MLWRSHTARAALALTIGLLGAATLTACAGSSDNGVATKSATEILAATRSAAQSASAVHVDSETLIGTAKLLLNAGLAKRQGQTRFSLLGAGAEEIRTGNTLYIKGNPLFNARLEARLGVKIPSGVWLKGPVGGPLPGTALTSIAKELSTILSSRGRLTKGPVTTIDGQPAIELKQKNQLYTGTLYIATTGQPYPIKLLRTGREKGQTTFTGWNRPLTLRVPANATDVSQLERRRSG